MERIGSLSNYAAPRQSFKAKRQAILHKNRYATTHANRQAVRSIPKKETPLLPSHDRRPSSYKIPVPHWWREIAQFNHDNFKFTPKNPRMNAPMAFLHLLTILNNIHLSPDTEEPSGSSDHYADSEPDLLPDRQASVESSDTPTVLMSASYSILLNLICSKAIGLGNLPIMALVLLNQVAALPKKSPVEKSSATAEPKIDPTQTLMKLSDLMYKAVEKDPQCLANPNEEVKMLFSKYPVTSEKPVIILLPNEHSHPLNKNLYFSSAIASIQYLGKDEGSILILSEANFETLKNIAPKGSSIQVHMETWDNNRIKDRIMDECQKILDKVRTLSKVLKRALSGNRHLSKGDRAALMKIASHGNENAVHELAIALNDIRVKKGTLSETAREIFRQSGAETIWENILKDWVLVDSLMNSDSNLDSRDDSLRKAIRKSTKEKHTVVIIDMGFGHFETAASIAIQDKLPVIISYWKSSFQDYRDICEKEGADEGGCAFLNSKKFTKNFGT